MYFSCTTLLDLLKFAIRFLSNRHCESSEVRRSPKSVHSLSRFTFFLCVPTPVLWVWTVNGKRGQLQGSCKPLAVQLEASGCRRRNRRHTGMVESRCDRKGQGKRAREGSSCVCVCAVPAVQTRNHGALAMADAGAHGTGPHQAFQQACERPLSERHWKPSCAAERDNGLTRHITTGRAFPISGGKLAAPQHSTCYRSWDSASLLALCRSDAKHHELHALAQTDHGISGSPRQRTGCRHRTCAC